MKQNKTITVFDQEQYDGEWPSENAADFISFFNGKIEEIPAEHRHTAKIEIDSVSGYEGSSYAHIEISYTRLETDEEEQARERQEQARKDSARQRELNELAKLKAKYPDACRG